jgi:hypothetical protein
MASTAAMTSSCPRVGCIRIVGSRKIVVPIEPHSGRTG